MKKTLVLRVTFVIIQLFCFTLYDNTIQAEFVGPLDVSEVIVRGAESFSPSWIIRQVGIKNYRSLTSETIVRQKAYEIEDLLKQRGFYFAACDYMIEELPENQEVKVTFRIDEGYRVIIEDVRFEGNFLIADRKLRDIVQTRPSGFFSKNFLNEEAISKDKNNIEKLYREEGIEAVVSRVEKAFNEEKNTVTVTFFIHEKSLTGSFHDQNARNVLEQFSLMQKELGELREDLKS
ncbi:MAG: hypothetical protein JW928_03985, partial [Candidatus Aureabacteria bacterium]|nr:hypothetical protein [Candidatus Auribacterota bacterium]